MSKTTIRAVFALLALTYVMTHFLGHAHAQSSLGIGTNEKAELTGELLEDEKLLGSCHVAFGASASCFCENQSVVHSQTLPIMSWTP